MIYLNAGNLWTMPYLEKVLELNSTYGESVKVASLFGSISELTPTARSADRIPKLDWPEIKKFVATATDSGITIRYTLNASCIDSLQHFAHTWYLHGLRDSIRRLHDLGVDCHFTSASRASPRHVSR